MFRKIYNKINPSKQGVPIEDIIQLVNSIAKDHSILSICSGVTGYNWMGVNRATKALFPLNTIELPQYYSQTIYSLNDLKKLTNAIANCGFEQVILSGFPAYFEILVDDLNKFNVKIKVIYHGFFSELAGNVDLQKLLRRLIDLSISGKIDTIAFNKKGMAESISQLWGINTNKIILPTRVSPIEKWEKNEAITRVGILGNEHFRKNIQNQIVAASLIPNAEIHVTSSEDFLYIPDHVKIHRHQSGLNHIDFLTILGNMDINMHISYSESWGQLTTESLSYGIPCLISAHSDIFDYDENLRKTLVVQDYDNVFAIKNQIIKVLDNPELSSVYKGYIDRLNLLSEESISIFLNDEEPKSSRIST